MHTQNHNFYLGISRTLRSTVAKRRHHGHFSLRSPPQHIHPNATVTIQHQSLSIPEHTSKNLPLKLLVERLYSTNNSFAVWLLDLVTTTPASGCIRSYPLDLIMSTSSKKIKRNDGKTMTTPFRPPPAENNPISSHTASGQKRIANESPQVSPTKPLMPQARWIPVSLHSTSKRSSNALLGSPTSVKK
jgi:hypothetical protein